MIPCKITLIDSPIECLEECLKYVLLLNFEEQPNYEYLIEELKKVYQYSLVESG